jgi:hypothetical protein
MTDGNVRIAVVYPELLGTYGDGGNGEVLQKRLEWRGTAAEVVVVSAQEPVPESCDVYLLGGGEDRAQVYAAERLTGDRGFARAVDRGAPVLAICAGVQILGESFSGPDSGTHSGAGMLAVQSFPLPSRAVGEIRTTAAPEWGLGPLTGFENHRSGTTLGEGARPLATVDRGIGNGTGDRAEGVVQGRIIGTYLHGPVLARNPALADLLLEWATGDRLEPLALPEVERLRSERLAG